MTREEILAMKPGEELDGLVAERIMGLKRGVDFGEWPEHQWKRDSYGNVDRFGFEAGHHNGPACERCGYSYCVRCQSGPTQPCVVEPEPSSTDIKAAWHVVERLDSQGAGIIIENLQNKWQVQLSGNWRGKPICVIADAATFPEVICRAALLALLQGGNGV